MKFILKVLLFIFFISGESYANCNLPIATTTNYFLPSAIKNCKTWYYGKRPKSKKKYDIQQYMATASMCSKFVTEVRMEGSGKYNPNEIYRYTGEVELMKGNGRNCETTVGSFGECMIPYISIAADKRKFNGGDIISMPAMKGKVLKLSNGKTFVHPGYFVVHDVGGAIKGAGRFDFFSGDMGPMEANNSFGYKGPSDTQMFSTDACLSRKSFLRITPKSPGFAAARLEIDKAEQTIYSYIQTQKKSIQEESRN